MPQFSSLKKPPLSQEVEKQIRTFINSGVYKPGDKLPPERELVDQFQVSRTTVRDALRNLQNRGLISVKRGVNAGAYVSEPNPYPITECIENLIQMKRVNFAHLIEIRLYVEPDVASAVARYHTPQDIDTLTELLDKAEKTLGSSRKKARLINVGFHFEVAKITGNALTIFLCQSITQVHSAMIIEMTRTKLDKKAIGKLIAEHRTILEAIAAKDPEEAFTRTRDHLVETYHTYSKIIPDAFDHSADERIKHFASL
ncbi:MAG: FadR family transcriptional regulator [Deltaproteobacteria bacterium]|nr:FadR family transcriptional regulator [Deltaproteobacteria bacterium]